MLRLFKSSDPLTLTVLIIYAALVNLKLLIEPPIEIEAHYNFISEVIFNKWIHLSSLAPRTIIIINIIFILTQSVFISMLMQKSKIISRPSMLPAMVFILLCSLFPGLLMNTPLIMSGFFLIWIIFKVFSSYNQSKADNIYFDVGLLSAFASLIYFPAIVFILYSIVAMVRIKTTSFREYILFLTGIFTIYFLAGTLLFWYDAIPAFLNDHFYFPASLESLVNLFTTDIIIKLALTGIVLMISLVFYSNRFSANLIQVRRYLGSFVILFFFSAMSLFLHQSDLESGLYFLLISATIFISYYFFHSPNRLIPELMHLGLLGATLIFQYINFTS